MIGSYKRRKQLKPSKYKTDKESISVEASCKLEESSKMLFNDILQRSQQSERTQLNMVHTSNPLEFLTQNFLRNLQRIINVPESSNSLMFNNNDSLSADVSLATSNSANTSSSLNQSLEKVLVDASTLPEEKTFQPMDTSMDDSDGGKKKLREEIKIQPYLTSNGVELFNCPLCEEKEISDRAKLTQHLQTHQSDHKRDDGKHICCFCFNELSSNSSLERHLLTHTNHRPFQCVSCDKAFTTNGNLSRHMKTSHQNLGKGQQLPKLSYKPSQMMQSTDTIPDQYNDLTRSEEKSALHEALDYPIKTIPAIPQQQPTFQPVFQPVPMNNFLLNALTMIHLQNNQPFLKNNYFSHLPGIVPQTSPNENCPLPVTTPRLSVGSLFSKTKDSLKTPIKKRKKTELYYYKYFHCKKCKVSVMKRNTRINAITHTCSKRHLARFPSKKDGHFIQEDVLDLSYKSREVYTPQAKSEPAGKSSPTQTMRDYPFSKENSVSSEETGVLAIRKKNSYKDAPRLISCPVEGCRQKFPWNSSLKRHILTHTPHKPFACTRCSKSFSTKSNRERHMERVHKVSLRRHSKKRSPDNLSSLSDQDVEESVVVRESELTGEELISMTTSDRHAEDISNKLLMTAGNPKVEPNPGRFQTTVAINDKKPLSQDTQSNDHFLLNCLKCNFCDVKVVGRSILLEHIMQNHFNR